MPRLPSRISALIRRSDGSVSRIFRDGGRLRREEKCSDGSWSAAVLREDLDCMFSITSSAKSYIRVPLGRLVDSMWQNHFEGAHCSAEGHEVIDGEKCDVFRVRVPHPIAPDGEPSVVTQIAYISQRTNWIRRLVNLNLEGIPQLTTDWLEVSLDPISLDVFEPPLDFVELELRTGRPVKKSKKGDQKLSSQDEQMGDYTTENPDDFCARLLSQGNREARDWLRESPQHTLGVMTNLESEEFVNSIYLLGAPGAFAVEIGKYTGGAENTGKMVIELPAEPGKRPGVIKWAAKIAHEQGFDAFSDVGQRYIFIMLD